MSTTFQKILVPIDFSDPCRKALERALSLATPLGARVDVLHVGANPRSYAPLDRWIWGKETSEHDMAQKIENASREAMSEFLADLPSETRAQLGTRLETGVPYEVITSIADKDGYDLIVIGTQGRTGASHVLMGSVAERVVRHAPCPVLVVR